MFHVLDHADVVYTGELSQTTQYVIEHYGQKLDDAIRSGIKIVCADPFRSLNAAGQANPRGSVPDFWMPIDDWELD